MNDSEYKKYLDTYSNNFLIKYNESIDIKFNIEWIFGNKQKNKIMTHNYDSDVIIIFFDYCHYIKLYHLIYDIL